MTGIDHDDTVKYFTVLFYLTVRIIFVAAEMKKSDSQSDYGGQEFARGKQDTQKATRYDTKNQDRPQKPQLPSVAW
jgi:hypothetical protein